jgi:hypothetical protein
MLFYNRPESRCLYAGIAVREANPATRLKSGAYICNLEGSSWARRDFRPTAYVPLPPTSPYRLHPDDLVTAIDINHLSGDGGSSITR